MLAVGRRRRLGRARRGRSGRGPLRRRPAGRRAAGVRLRPDLGPAQRGGDRDPARARTGWPPTSTRPDRPTGGWCPATGLRWRRTAQAVDVEPEVAGKPYRPLVDATVARLGAGHPIFVGDRLDTDIAGAVAAGLDSMLVLTGLPRPGRPGGRRGRQPAHPPGLRPTGSAAAGPVLRRASGRGELRGADRGGRLGPDRAGRHARRPLVGRRRAVGGGNLAWRVADLGRAADAAPALSGDQRGAGPSLTTQAVASPGSRPSTRSTLLSTSRPVGRAIDVGAVVGHAVPARAAPEAQLVVGWVGQGECGFRGRRDPGEDPAGGAVDRPAVEVQRRVGGCGLDVGRDVGEPGRLRQLGGLRRRNRTSGRTLVHGSGTRQPSRPFSRPAERNAIGSCSASRGRSATSGSPSSSPW